MLRKNLTLVGCTLLASLITFIACGGGQTGGGGSILPPILGSSKQIQAAITTRPGGHLHLADRVTAVASIFALFQTSGSSTISQSFEAECYSTPTGIPQFSLQGSKGGDCAAAWNSDAQPWESGKVFDAGTVTTLLVDASGSQGATGTVEIWIDGKPTAANCSIDSNLQCKLRDQSISVADRSRVGFVVKNWSGLTSVRAYALKQ